MVRSVPFVSELFDGFLLFFEFFEVLRNSLRLLPQIPLMIVRHGEILVSAVQSVDFR